MSRILLVDDDRELTAMLAEYLEGDGFQVSVAHTGDDGLARARSGSFDALVLDVMLPGRDGFEVLRALRHNHAVPVLMLTARGDDVDTVVGLELGADDYLPKPFSPKVFVARVRAVLRRASQPQEVQQTTVVKTDVSDQPMQAGELLIHPGHYQVVRGETTIDLTATEFRVLAFLAGKPGRVFTRQQILDGVHGDNYAITDRAIDVQIVAIRKKLGEAGRYIETVRGIGYRFRDALPDAPAT